MELHVNYMSIKLGRRKTIKKIFFVEVPKIPDDLSIKERNSHAVSVREGSEPSQEVLLLS